MTSPIQLSDNSGFRFYSEGVVTEILGNGKLKVSPLETLNAQPSGHIIENKVDYESKHPSDSAATSTASVSSESVVEAEWVPLNAGNRVTPPNVVVNERVMLLKHSNVDKFYWIDKGFNALRRLETVEYRFGGLKLWNATDGSETAQPDLIERDSSYYLLVDTLGQKVEFGTSAKNQEMTTYKFSIDTKTGVLTITDGYENQIKLDSDKGKLEVKTRNEIALNTERRVYIKSPAVSVDSSIYVSGDVHAKGDLCYGGALIPMAKSGPGGSNNSIKATEEISRLRASGVDMSNPFLSMMVGQNAPSLGGTNIGETISSLTSSAASIVPNAVTSSQQALTSLANTGFGTNTNQLVGGFNTVVGQINNAADSVSNLGGNLVNGAVDRVTSTVNGVIGQAVNAANAAVGQVVSAANSAANQVLSTANQAVAVTNNLVTQVQGAVSDVMYVSSQTASVVDTTINNAAGVTQEVMNAFDETNFA